MLSFNNLVDNGFPETEGEYLVIVGFHGKPNYYDLAMFSLNVAGERVCGTDIYNAHNGPGFWTVMWDSNGEQYGYDITESVMSWMELPSLLKGGT